MNTDRLYTLFKMFQQNFYINSVRVYSKSFLFGPKNYSVSVLAGYNTFIKVALIHSVKNSCIVKMPLILIYDNVPYF